MIKEIPILFSTPMVQAILYGRKTMTRRIVKPQPRKLQPGMIPAPIAIHPDDYEWPNRGSFQCTTVSCKKNGPDNWIEENSKWKVGDVLWVRESGWVDNNYMPSLNDPHLFWKADYDNYPEWQKVLIRDHTDKFPSIHMYKVFSRIWLEVTNIRVERLHDISEEDAKAEGVQRDTILHHVRYKDYYADASGYGHPDVDFPTVSTAIESFISLWFKINGEESWNANPWVWVIEFKVLSTTGKPLLN